MNKPQRLMTKIGIMAAGLTMIAAMPATAAFASPNTAKATATAAPQVGAFTKCPAGDWCLFSGTNGAGFFMGGPASGKNLGPSETLTNHSQTGQAS